MAIDKQRAPQLGDWTVCQDKETTKTAIRTNSIDSANQLNVLDWSIADFNGGKETPYLYVPNRVYPMDTVILKPTLEGLMPIPENLDGNCYFETASNQILTAPYKPSSSYCDIANCPNFGYGKICGFNITYFEGKSCTKFPGVGVTKLAGVRARGLGAYIIFRIRAVSAFEYLDIRITNWPQSGELDAMGWPPGESPGEDFVYQSLGNNVFRIWAWPGGGRNGRWGPAGTDVMIRVHFTLMGGVYTETVYAGSFPGVQRDVTVSYVGAGRRGNHR